MAQLWWLTCPELTELKQMKFLNVIIKELNDFLHPSLRYVKVIIHDAMKSSWVKMEWISIEKLSLSLIWDYHQVLNLDKWHVAKGKLVPSYHSLLQEEIPLQSLDMKAYNLMIFDVHTVITVHIKIFSLTYIWSFHVK